MQDRTAVLLVLVASWPVLAGFAAPQQQARGPVATSIAADTLASPPPMANRARAPRTVEVTLTAAPAKLPLAPGGSSDVYAYDGRVPGPTLEVREGDRVVVHFRNRLPEATTVHWHGLQVPADVDGSPFHPVAAGEDVDYEFTIPRGSAGTYWYHPHPHHVTGVQVAKGLYGAIIVRADDDPLPASLPEKLLILSDNRFLADHAIDLPARESPQGRVDFENGREGDVLFVNGAVRPRVRIRSGEVQRWRVINASAARVYRLAIPGHKLLHVGSDGGLFETPVEVEEILLANGERAELLVRGTGAPGSATVLQSLPYDRYIPQTKPKDWAQPRELLALDYVGDAPVKPPVIPARLRAIPALDPASATATRLMVLSQGMINGKLMDFERVDVTAEIGATEIWEIENVVGMDHPFHLHGYQFQLLERNGVPEPYRSWKDTVNVPRHGTARFIVRYDGRPGKWMFHCHILDHEDHGMMGVLQIR